MAEIDYQSIVERICANPKAITPNDQITVSHDQILSGTVWAQKASGALDVAMTMRRITDPRLRGRSSYGDCTFKTLAEITTVPDRYLPGSHQPLLDEDHGGQLDADELILVHQVVERGIHTDVYDVIQNILDGKLARYVQVKRELDETKASNPGKWAQYVADIHRPAIAMQRIEDAPQSSSAPMTLRDVLNTKFDLSDLYDVCYQLGVDHELIAGGSKPLFVVNMIGYFTRRGSLDALTTKVRQLRPRANF